MEARGDAINFRTVAAHGGVSKDFLYSQPDLVARIRDARVLPSRDPVVPAIERPSAKSTTVQLSVIKTSNEALRREVVELRNENARLRGELLKLRGLRLPRDSVK